MDIAAEKHVSLTTVRRSGDIVVSPVWIAPLAGGKAGFITDGTSGKVKRLRNNDAVTMQACSMRGAVVPGSPVVSGTAIVVEGSEFEAVERAITTKYGVVARIVGIGSAIKKLFGRPNSSVGIVITITDPAAD